MERAARFTNPEWEPTDEDLRRLVSQAFAGLADAHAESLRQMRARIEAAQARARQEALTWARQP